MNGREFDRAFVHYMIDDHRQDIAEFQEEAHAMNGPASHLVREQLPTLQKHLDIALSIAHGGGDREDGPGGG